MELKYLDNDIDYSKNFKQIKLPDLFNEPEISKRELTELEKFGEFRKYCFNKAKKEWNSPKPFAIHWGQKTSHLKSLSDWSYLKSICDDAERRGDIWSRVFWGSLKPK